MTKPDRPSLPPAFKRYMDAHTHLTSGLTYLTRAMDDDVNLFRGMTMFQGDNNAYVVGVKRWGENGRPEIIWSSGRDPVDAIVSVDLAVKTGKWVEDKRANVKK